MVSIPACCLLLHGPLIVPAVSPGRLFAASEVKLLVAHLVVTYDMKFEDGKGAPPEFRIARLCIPGTSDVMFKKWQK
jgi:hypothetical protein